LGSREVRRENDRKDDFERNGEMKKLIMMLVAVAAAMPLMADEETVGGYTWADCIGRDIVENAV